MKKTMHPIQHFLLEHIAAHPQDSVALAMGHFKVSRTTVLRHLGHLIKAKQVIKTGTTKQTCYALTTDTHKQFQFSCEPGFDEFKIFTDYLEKDLNAFLNREAFSVAEYTVTEILNNAKDHSKGRVIRLELQVEAHQVKLIIEDDGVGVFKHLQQAYHFDDVREALFELSKGKLTSDPAHHSGEGIFFSSRACNVFSITANGFSYVRDNNIHDWTFFKSDLKPGTSVELIISRKCPLHLTEIFIAHQDEDSLAFTKTDVLIDLAQGYGERLISRSQAQRVCRNLEKFNQVTLDFKRIQAIGQGFVDQVFRVYQQQRPDLTLRYINANPEVEFMIKRGLP